MPNYKIQCGSWEKNFDGCNNVAMYLVSLKKYVRVDIISSIGHYTVNKTCKTPAACLHLRRV